MGQRVTRLAMVSLIAATLALALGGCTKCGWIFDSSAACKSDIPR